MLKSTNLLKRKLENNETLSDKELMQLIILPLAKKGKEEKQRMIEQVVDLAKQIDDEKHTGICYHRYSGEQ